MKNIEKENLLKKRFRLFVKVISLFILTFVILYSFGFKIQSNLRVSKNAKVFISIKEKNTIVTLNDKLKVKTEDENQEVSFDIPIKLNSIKVSKDGYFLWQKNIYPKPNQKIYLEPIFKKISSSGFIIRENDPQYYYTYYKVLNETPKPTKEKPKTLDDVKIWSEQNTIMVSQNGEDFGILESTGEIRSLDFYKDNKNYIVYSADSGVYILEINQDDNNLQNSFPVYSGTSPVFIYKDQNNLYIVDGKTLLEIEI